MPRFVMRSSSSVQPKADIIRELRVLLFDNMITLSGGRPVNSRLRFRLSRAFANANSSSFMGFSWRSGIISSNNKTSKRSALIPRIDAKVDRAIPTENGSPAARVLPSSPITPL